MFKGPDSSIDIRERSPLALAFVGDGVLELLVRSKIVSSSRAAPAVLHRRAVELVSAKAQFVSLERLDPFLSDKEKAVVRRGRNANKATVSKHATAEEYRASTGLEALFGWLYLQNDIARIEELFQLIWNQHNEALEE